MTRKDKILDEALEKNNLQGKFAPDGLIWNIITDCMQRYVNEAEIDAVSLTIGDAIEVKKTKKVAKKAGVCDHDWLLCGNAVWICGKECGEYESR